MSERSKEYLKSRGLKNPPIDSGISGGGDAPRTYVSDIMDEWNPYLTKLLEQKETQLREASKEFQIADKKRVLVEDHKDRVGDFFGAIHSEYDGNKFIEVQDFTNSETRLSLLKVDDKTVAFVIESRTAFNHCEFVFCRETAHSENDRLRAENQALREEIKAMQGHADNEGWVELHHARTPIGVLEVECKNEKGEIFRAVYVDFNNEWETEEHVGAWRYIKETDSTPPTKP